MLGFVLERDYFGLGGKWIEWFRGRNCQEESGYRYVFKGNRGQNVEEFYVNGVCIFFEVGSWLAL